MSCTQEAPSVWMCSTFIKRSQVQKTLCDTVMQGYVQGLIAWQVFTGVDNKPPYNNLGWLTTRTLKGKWCSSYVPQSTTLTQINQPKTSTTHNTNDKRTWTAKYRYITRHVVSCIQSAARSSGNNLNQFEFEPVRVWTSSTSNHVLVQTSSTLDQFDFKPVRVRTSLFGRNWLSVIRLD